MVSRNTNSDYEEIKQAAEDDIWIFAQLINPHYLYGSVHKEALRHAADTGRPNKLLLLPRGHLKSHCIAVWCVWWITKHPETTMLYLSATTTLAESQLYAIKNMLTCPKYKMYWPEMVTPDEGKREKWSTAAIAVDHPTRKSEGIRDMTVSAAGLSTTTSGWHADIIVADDVVVPENAYTKEGRLKVEAAMSQMSSILNPGGMIKACGTRYHPDDIYGKWLEQEIPTYDSEGFENGVEPLWDVLEDVVEVNGKFLWPRGARDDGKMFGFDKRELARISVMYLDRTQFHYYNDPNDPESQRLSDSDFQYYDQSEIRNKHGVWHFGEARLNVYAAMDFAFSIKAKADFSAIAVIGIDAERNIFVLDIDRFKTDKIAVYYEHLERMHVKWEFRKLRAEVSVAQNIIVNDLKDKIERSGSLISVDSFRPTGGAKQGNKEERIAAILEPRYADKKM